jgi:putative flippase GtrA
MSFPDGAVDRLPEPLRALLRKHAELVKFAIVGGTTFVIDSVIFYVLKLTVMQENPVTAKVIAGVIAVLASYWLNRKWSFKNRGGRDQFFEAVLFFAVSGVGVVLSFIPLYISSYAFGLRVPNVSLTVENIADFISAYIIGNLLQMAFRFWAFRRFVFPDEITSAPAPMEPVTAGALVEDLADEQPLGS